MRNYIVKFIVQNLKKEKSELVEAKSEIEARMYIKGKYATQFTAVEILDVTDVTK